MTEPVPGGGRVPRRPFPPGAALRWAAAVLGVTVAVTGVVFLGARLHGTPFEDLSKDPVATLGGPIHVGWYHYLVMLVWHAAAVVALFGAWLLRRLHRPDDARYLLAAAVLTAAMVLDDVFLLHEGVYRSAGIPEEAVYAAYALATALFAWWYRHRLGTGGLLVVSGAFCLWTVSGLLDVILQLDAPYVVEDGAKAAGVALWVLLVARLAAVEILGALAANGSDRSAGRHRA